LTILHFGIGICNREEKKNFFMMNYPVHDDGVNAQPTTKSSSSKLIICAAVSLSIFLSIAIVGIGLGVGFGIGLRNKWKVDSSTSESNVLSAPIVNCTYINSLTCGCTATKPRFLSPRIVNGNTAVAHSWPWTVVLYYKNAQLCDGFLVTYQHVITAAHCVSSLTKTSLQIYAGVHSLSSSTDKQIRDVSQIKIHPDYSITTLLNDIAILKLSSSLIPTTNVGLCCLSSDISLPIQNEPAVIVGWGRTSPIDVLSISDTLQQTVIKIQDSSTCHSNSNLYRQFCASYASSDSCQGDSGGPLMTNVNNLWTCTGIVSYGTGCGAGGYYTRVSYYKSFIDNAIATL
jgi:secreted trypsin-like serine protease